MILTNLGFNSNKLAKLPFLNFQPLVFHYIIFLFHMQNVLKNYQLNTDSNLLFITYLYLIILEIYRPLKNAGKGLGPASN